jgi:hypothetical protein
LAPHSWRVRQLVPSVRILQLYGALHWSRVGRRICDRDLYACSDSLSRDSPQSCETVVPGSGGREPSRLVSAHPGVSRRQWSQRSLSRSGDRTIQSSCPSNRHRIENRISTPPHDRVTADCFHRQLEQRKRQRPRTDGGLLQPLAAGVPPPRLRVRAFQIELNAFTLKR